MFGGSNSVECIDELSMLNVISIVAVTDSCTSAKN